MPKCGKQAMLPLVKPLRPPAITANQWTHIAVSLNLHLLQSEKTPKSDKKEIVENIVAVNNRAVESSRKIAHNLFQPIFEKFGLKAALDELISDFKLT